MRTVNGTITPERVVEPPRVTSPESVMMHRVLARDAAATVPIPRCASSARTPAAVAARLRQRQAPGSAGRRIARSERASYVFTHVAVVSIETESVASNKIAACACFAAEHRHGGPHMSSTKLDQAVERVKVRWKRQVA